MDLSAAFKRLDKSNRRLLQNLLSLLSAEGVHRISRLLSIIVIARALGVEAYGTMVFVAICHESFRSLSKLSGGLLIIQCKQRDLLWVAQQAASLNWGIAIITMILQWQLANVIGSYFNQLEAATLLKYSALAHLLYPLVMVRVNLMHRRQQLKRFAVLSTSSVVVEDLSCAFLAFYLQSAWCIVFAKLASAAMWCFLFYRYSEDNIEAKFKANLAHKLLRQAIPVFGSELAKQFRLSCDVFIAARVLGPEAFGFYSFARNAAIGIAQSLGNAFLRAIHPYLAKEFSRNEGFSAIWRSYGLCLITSSFFVLQSLLAPLYVPLLFGEAWQGAVKLVSLLCYASVALLLLDCSLLIIRCLNYFKWEALLQSAGLLSLCALLQFSYFNSAYSFAQAFVVGLGLMSFLLMISLNVYLYFNKMPGGHYE